MTHAVWILDDKVIAMCGEPLDLEVDRVVPFDARSLSMLRRAYRYVSCLNCYNRVANQARRMGCAIPGEIDD